MKGEPRDQLAIERKKHEQQRAIVVGVGLKKEDSKEYKESLLELIELTETAGAKVVGSTSQVLEKFSARTLIGKGKLIDIRKLVEDADANLVVIDHQLSGSQSMNLEKELKVAVIDRTQVILDIFAKRAQSHEGKLQVELAQILDQLPRMVGAWMGSLSRQGGGIGTQGPGETALELDRRRIRKRVDQLRKQLKEVQKRRSQHRQSRRKNRIPTFALIGYTNAGKSALMNALTNAETFTENQVFATLDPTTRKVYLEGGPEAVITDTVGFIRRLPTKLIEAFKATLEESAEADVLLHVIDLSSDNMQRHQEVVDNLILEFKWTNKPIIYVYNKVDLCSEKQKLLANGYPRVFVSALENTGLEDLKTAMRMALESNKKDVELFIPLNESHLIYDLSREIDIKKQEEGTTGTIIKAKLTEAQIQKWGIYIQS
tara:strand:- start:2456 stop:3745 length:1290 start_codon:yes stop_codon:yes gene_type:complete